MSEFCFVEVTGNAAQRSGGSGGNRNSKAMRQHVRKAVLRTRQHATLDGRMKHFTGTQFVASTKTKSPTKVVGNEVVKLTPSRSGACPRQWSVLKAQPILRHPYTGHAASVVQLPIERIDYLFKSRAQLPLLPIPDADNILAAFFRDACEPLFSVELVEAAEAGFRMEDVFPGCLQDAAYFHALLLAISLLANKGTQTVESLRLQGHALKSVRNRLLTASEHLNHADVGGMLILQGIAYRWNDVQSHDAHSTGLIHVRRCQQERDSCLTPMGERAMFWQDFWASILIGSTRFGSNYYPPEIRWRREVLPTPAGLLPIGFVQNADILPECLLECVCDINEMQELVSLQKGHLTKTNRIRIDNMQASIESRLAWDQAECPPLHPIVECVRLAVLLTCFLTFNQTWPHSLIPSRLCRRLKGCLIVTIYDTQWVTRRDLQLWCLFVGSNVLAPRSKVSDEPIASWKELFRLVNEDLNSHNLGGGDQGCLDSALRDFVYCEGWLQNRHNVEEWREVECALREGSPLSSE